MTRRTALVALTLTAVAIAILLAAAAGYHPPAGAGDLSKGDLALYGRVADRMRSGEGYYAAAHAELRAGGYGTRSVFNWRPPALPWLASLLPSAASADMVLRAVAVAAALAAAMAIAGSAGWLTGGLALLALALNLVTAGTPGGAVFADIVAGVLLLASVAAYGLRRPIAGMLIALAALFMRELAAPFVCVAIFLGWRENRRNELWAWAAGLAVFAAYFAWHAAAVHAQLGPNDIAYKSGWLQFGGLNFILATASFNGFFIAAPIWLSAIVLPLCLLGLAGWGGALGRRVGLSVAAYLVLFAVAGKPANDYWGALYTPLMMLGLAFLPAALGDLWRTMREGRAT